MIKVFSLLAFLLTFKSFSQCWKSLDVNGDTNSVHYGIQSDGSLWQFQSSGSAIQIGNQNIWKNCYTSFSNTSYINTVHLIANDSTLWGFGNNFDGQLGNGIDFEQIDIIQLNQYKWIDLTAGEGRVYGIRSDGSLWKWGNGQFTPIQIGNQYNWKKISATHGEFVAIKNDGSIWKGNFNTSPVQVGNQFDWNYVWYNWDGWYSIKTNGTLWFSQYGTSNVLQVGGDSDWKMINGYNNLFAIKTNGSLWYWSSNWDVLNIYPEQIGITNFKDISSGVYDYVYAISENGDLYKGNVTWGNNIPALLLENNANYLCSSVCFQVFNDLNQQCSGGIGIEGITITVQPGNYVSITDQNGFACISNLQDGNYTAIIDTTNPNWLSSCPTTMGFVVIDGYEPTDSNYFYLYNTNPCTDPDVSIYAPFLRPCLPSQMIYVSACNQPTATGILNSSYVDVELDPLMAITSSSLPYTPQGNNVYRFQTGDIYPDQCVNFNISTTISSQTIGCADLLGLTLCMDANLYPVQSCALDTIPSDPIVNDGTGGTLNGFPQPCTLPWDQSSLSVDGWCQGDSVYFSITNTGEPGGGDMECYSPMWVTVDGVVTYTDSIIIPGGQTVIVSYFGNGQTWILNAEQHPLHPGNSHPNAHVEACGDTASWTPDIVNDFPQDDADPVVDIYCGVVTGSYDPNDKTGYPIGQTDQKYIQPNQQLQYVIRFQNTGTDTAFTVVIRDTLDTDLNIFTVTSGVSSHPYEFRMYGPRVLEWTFNNINLPDSSTNQEGSNGFVTFHVDQVPNLAPGTEITNDADIYFDFNDPITTNTTIHRIYEGFVNVLNVEELTQNGKSLLVYPNPTSQSITIKGEKNMNQSFSIYDQMGREVFKGKLNGITTEVNLSILSKGIYTLKIDEKYKPAQIVKE